MHPRIKLFFAPCEEMKKDIFFFVLRVFVFTLFWGLLVSVLLSRFSALLLERNQEAFERLVYGYGVSLVLYYVFTVFIRHTGAPNMRAKLWKFIHRRYARKVCELDNNHMESLGSWRVFSIIDKGGQAWDYALKSIFQEGTRVLVIGIPTVVLLAKQSVSIIAFAWGTVFVGSLFVFWLNGKLRTHKIDRTKAVTEYDRFLIRTIQSRLEITQNQTLEHNLAKLDEKIEEFRIPQRLLTGVQVLMFQWARVMSYTILLSLYWILGHAYLEGQIALPDLILLASLAGVLSWLFFDITELYMNLSDQFVSIEQLWTKIDDAPKTKNLFSGTPFVYSKGIVEFRGVHFRYESGAPVLENFTYRFEAGKKYALVWPSGGGKTTVMKLASGFLSANSWKITVDGFDLSTVNLSTFYPTIGYLTQDPQVFDGTIRENLLQGNLSDAPEDSIAHALRQAHAEFAYDLPNGLDTEIGERGVKLSGGQKQRIAIAKIFLKNPHIVFLDEPTSALDSFSEEKISQAFHTLFEWRTVFVIAHRLQTVKEADVILVLEKGRVVEEGNHESLVLLGGTYAKMLQLQGGF